MKSTQMKWNSDGVWVNSSANQINKQDAQLVLVFSSPEFVDSPALGKLREQFPNARIVGGTSAGNVLDTTFSENDMVATATSFDSCTIDTQLIVVDDDQGIFEQINEVARSMLKDDLKHLLVFSDGLTINGSELARALNISDSVSVIGGLMGDNGDFEKTYVFHDDVAYSNAVVLVGFYGEDLKVGNGCYAGWNEFGVKRKITKSIDNIVYEIDHEPALELYKKYLGEFAADLPGSGLRFPLSITDSTGVPVIRTLLAVDEDTQSLTFAGDVPEGATTLLMKGNIENMIDGAGTAANRASIDCSAEGLAIAISCVGRRMLMDQLIEEELETVKDSLSPNTTLTGFYSYGEIAPYSDAYSDCQLHNQTMTLFTLYE